MFVNLLNPILELQHAPLPPKCCEPGSVPQLPSLMMFSLQIHVWIYQGVWECVTWEQGQKEVNMCPPLVPFNTIIYHSTHQPIVLPNALIVHCTILITFFLLKLNFHNICVLLILSTSYFLLSFLDPPSSIWLSPLLICHLFIVKLIILITPFTTFVMLLQST